MNKHLTTFAALFLAANSFAQTKAAPRAASAEPAKIEIPKGATQVSKDVFRHTDTSGKTYLYRKTPFGVQRAEEQQSTSGPAPVRDAAAKPNPFNTEESTTSTPEVKVVQKGDTFHFERTTPFGPARWSKNKSELNAEETAVVEKSHAQTVQNTGSK
ncbi:MAG TPA: hypothetical protein VEQ63_04395 [Bryobacteraceae bacterium]|nr:hypothetical protein [Bryobacteraceae bacterium]